MTKKQAERYAHLRHRGVLLTMETTQHDPALMRDALTRCWCDAKGEWTTDHGAGVNYLCDEHKRECEAMPENAHVEFFRLGPAPKS